LGINKKVLLSTGSLVYRFSLPQISAFAAESGLDGLEIVLNNKAFLEIGKDGKKIFSNLPVPVLSLHAPHHSSRIFRNLEDGLKKTIDLARENEIKRIVFHPPSFPLFQPKFSYFFFKTRSFKELVDQDYILMIENLPKTALPYPIGSPQKIKNFLIKKGLFIALDCSHYASWGGSPVEALDLFGNLIKNVHLTNTHHCHFDSHHPPYEGCVDLTSFLKELGLKKLSEDVHLVLEIDFGLKTEKEIKSVILKSLDFINNHLNQ